MLLKGGEGPEVMMRRGRGATLNLNFHALGSPGHVLIVDVVPVVGGGEEGALVVEAFGLVLSPFGHAKGRISNPVASLQRSAR